jgi:hypothetical protein
MTINTWTALRYIHRIRNTAKRAYALDYLDYLQGKTVNEPYTGNLSAMAAQSVRLKLHELDTAKEEPADA